MFLMACRSCRVFLLSFRFLQALPGEVIHVVAVAARLACVWALRRLESMACVATTLTSFVAVDVL